jgi:hypothetical protein
MSGNRMLTYTETLNLIEKFMVGTKIRKYCTDMCKGSCCGSCYKSNPEACHKQEGRRLSCSVFICYSLLNLFSKKDMLIFLKVQRTIEKEYHKYSPRNPYFNVPSSHFLKQALFPSEIIEALNIEMLKKVKKVITILIKNKRNVRRSHTSKKYIEERL